MKAYLDRSANLTPVLMRVQEVEQSRVPLKEYSNKFLREARGNKKID